MSQSDMYTTAPVSVSNSLGDCRDDNPRRDPYPLYPNFPHPLVPHRLLCGTGGEYNLWCERSYRGLPYLSANKVQMGTNYGRRLLRRSEIPRYVYRNLEPATGRRGCGLTHADTVGIADGKEQKGGVELHVRSRYHVWLPNPPSLRWLASIRY